MLNPLSSLTIDADAIINQCELAEMSPNTLDELMVVSIALHCIALHCIDFYCIDLKFHTISRHLTCVSFQLDTAHSHGCLTVSR